MYLEKLEIFGFKSFARKTILKFLPGVACVVGPNGSGKSNISDGIRWVLGEQSMKLLRGKKSEDVIFSGSAKLPRLGFAQVSLYLNNEDKKAPVDYSEIVITRRLYRNGESEYLLNKSKARLQDILLLLAKSNFGQKSYSIIGQGMIDSVLIASPQEKKEFFDEAAGVKQYQIKKEQTLLKLEATKENLKQAEIIIQEIEPHLKSLTKQVKKLEKREEMEKILKENQKKYYSFLWRKTEECCRKEMNESEESEKKYQKTKEELSKIQDKIKNLSQTQLKTEDAKILNLQKEYQEILKIKNDFLKQQVILEGKIEIEKEKLKEKPSLLNITSRELNEFLENLEKIKSLHQNLILSLEKVKNIEEIDAIKQELRLINKEVLSLILKIKKPEISENSQEKIAFFERDLADIFQLIKEKEGKLKIADEKIGEYRRKEQEEMEELFNLERQFQSKQNEFNQINSLNNEVKIELAKAEAKKEDLKKKILEELKDLKEIEGELREENIDSNLFLSEIGRLKHYLEAIGSIDPEVSKEYQKTKERFDFFSSQIQDLKNAISGLEKLIKELDEIIKKQFANSFDIINREFERYFKILFDGGKAKLILQKEENRSLNIENEGIAENLEPKKKGYNGIEIQVTPPGKRLKNINLLSGGERALTALALICAIISCNPSPFVILDEVDASLDEANSIKFANIIQDLSYRSQFIIITHNRATMEKAKILYGVTIEEDGVSKLISIKLEDIVNPVE